MLKDNCEVHSESSDDDSNNSSPTIRMHLSVPGRKRKLNMSLHLSLDDDDFDYDWEDWLRESVLDKVGVRPRSMWVHPVNLARPVAGEFARVCVPYRQYPDKFSRYFRIDYILHSIEQDIVKHSNRKCISPAERLAVTLR